MDHHENVVHAVNVPVLRFPPPRQASIYIMQNLKEFVFDIDFPATIVSSVEFTRDLNRLSGITCLNT